MRRYVLALALLLSACARAPLPVQDDARDMAPRDLPPIPVCVRCDAVLNPCPGLGLICLPATGVCVQEYR